MLSNERPVDAVYPNDNNPRRTIFNDQSARDPEFLSLVESVRSQGILTPLLINKDGMILAGHRRYQAALEIGLEKIPVRVIPDKNDHSLVPLIENLQRRDLAVLEVADYLLKCRKEHGMTITAIASITGISETTIGHYLKLAEAPPEVRERIDGDEIPLGAAFELLRHDEGFIKEVIKTPRLTKHIVQERAQALDMRPRAAVALKPMLAERCPKDRKAHLEYAIRVVGELLAAAPDDSFAVRYKRWIVTMEDDLADMRVEIDASFRGAVNSFQRQPKAARG